MLKIFFGKFFEIFSSSKYGNIDKRKGNPMLMKKLAGKKQYFDSGDYNMQKEKVKGPAVPNPLAAKNPSEFFRFYNVINNDS